MTASSYRRHQTHASRIWILLGLAILAFVPFQAPGAATVLHQKYEVSFTDYLVPNYCTGEIINETGTVTVWVHLTRNANGMYRFKYHEHFKATGIGSYGNEYVIQDQYTVREFDTREGAVQWTDTFEFVQISKGPEENSRFFQEWLFIISPDGSFEAILLKNRFGCGG